MTIEIDLGLILVGRSLLGQIGRSLLLIYGLVNLLVFFVADRLIFQPPTATYQDSPEIIKLPTRHQRQISALYLPHPAAYFTILYSHGNGSDLGTVRSNLEKMRSAGFAVFAYDYQGYGTSQGRPSEPNTYADIAAAYDYLTQTLKVSSDRLILYGFSVGSGPSVDLAIRRSVAGIILEGAFTSTFRVAIPFPILLFDRFCNINKIKSVRCPILVIHGTQDHVIPFHHGQTLYQSANPPKQFLVVEMADHNNLIDIAGNQYSHALQEFAHQIKPDL